MEGPAGDNAVQSVRGVPESRNMLPTATDADVAPQHIPLVSATIRAGNVAKSELSLSSWVV